MRLIGIGSKQLALYVGIATQRSEREIKSWNIDVWYVVAQTDQNAQSVHHVAPVKSV